MKLQTIIRAIIAHVNAMMRSDSRPLSSVSMMRVKMNVGTMR